MQYKTEVEQIAYGLIQSYIGPDHKVIEMRQFFCALVQALAGGEEVGQWTMPRRRS